MRNAVQSRSIGRVVRTATAVLLAVAGTAAAAVIVSPNPWIPEDKKPATGTVAGGIRFSGLPTGGEVLVYTVTGERVVRIPYVGEEVRWDGKNDDNQAVASGVYLWIVRSGDFSKKGKLVVIR